MVRQAHQQIRTRFAPSPTGNLHIGSLRTALYAFALAKHSKGDFILRIEDTDKKREVEGSVEKIKELLGLFGIVWDEYFVQSERMKTGIYEKFAKELVKKGKAYEDEGAIRIKIPKNEKISYRDFVLDKEVSWDTNTLEDLAILKSDGFPTYHLASVVDDHEMGITHVLRGHDWLPSTPIHLLLYKFLNWERPEIGHLTDILDPEGGKLSKRKGSTSVEGLMEEGYLPEAILNFIMLLGWAPKDNREIFSLEEFVKAFDPKGLQKANPIFNREKLKWFNGYYRETKSPKEYISYISSASVYADNPKFSDVVDASATVLAPRVSNVFEYDAYVKPFYNKPVVKRELLSPNAKKHLDVAYNVLKSLGNWTKENIDKKLLDAIKENDFKTGEFFMDFRVALTGEKFTMPISDFVAIAAYYAKVFDKNDILERLKVNI